MFWLRCTIPRSTPLPPSNSLISPVKGASRGEGLGNKFLSHIREVDAIVHVVRCFEDDNVIHVDGNVDPARDIDVINTELVLADIEAVTKRAEKAAAMLKKGDKKFAVEAETGAILLEHLNEGKPARTAKLNDEQREVAEGWFLITMKKVIYAANIGEDDLGKDESELVYVQKVREIAESEAAEVLVISAQVEQEIAQLEPEEKQMFLDDMGIYYSHMLDGRELPGADCNPTEEEIRRGLSGNLCRCTGYQAMVDAVKSLI